MGLKEGAYLLDRRECLGRLGRIHLRFLLLDAALMCGDLSIRRLRSSTLAVRDTAQYAGNLAAEEGRWGAPAAPPSACGLSSTNIH